MLTLASIKTGNWLVLIVGVLCIMWVTVTLWQGGAADKAIIRSSGRIFSELLYLVTKLFLCPAPSVLAWLPYTPAGTHCSRSQSASILRASGLAEAGR